MSAVANMTFTVMNLRRSARIADKYDDSFSYCETTKDDRSVSDFDFVPQRVKAIRLRRSARIADKYDDSFSYCEPTEFDVCMEDAVKDSIREEVRTHLRRSSRLAEKNAKIGSYQPTEYAAVRRSTRLAQKEHIHYCE
jgi:hypothetical protein